TDGQPRSRLAPQAGGSVARGKGQRQMHPPLHARAGRSLGVGRPPGFLARWAGARAGGAYHSGHGNRYRPLRTQHRRRVGVRRMIAILRFCLKDLLRSRFIAAYFLFHLAAGFALMRYAPTASAGFGALLSLVLFLAPLCSIVFGTLYFYQARGFQELMLAQPVG